MGWDATFSTPNAELNITVPTGSRILVYRHGNSNIGGLHVVTNDRKNKLYGAEKEVVKDTFERLWEHVVTGGL